MITFGVMRYLIYISFLTTALLLPCKVLAQEDLDKADSLKQAGNYTEALKIFESHLEQSLKTNNIKDQARGYNNIANVYSDKNEYEKSTEYYFKALKLAEKENNDHTQAAINYNIASNFIKINKLNYAEEYLNKAVEKIKDKAGEEEILGLCYNMLGALAIDGKKLSEALDYLKKAENVFLKLDRQDHLGNIYVEFTLLYHELKDQKMAMQYSRKGISLFRKQNDLSGVAISYINLSRAHFYYWNPGPEISNRKETIKAIEYEDSAYQALKGTNNQGILINIYKNKQGFYKGLGQHDSAYFYLTKYVLLNDSLNGVEKNRQLDELKIQYDVEKKERENELLNAKNERRALLAIIGFSAASCLLLLFLIFILRNRHKKKQKETQFEKNILEFQQQALRAQMNPHFIFNAINSIQKFILKENKQKAYDYLSKFAKLIRIVLNNSREKNLMLSQELEMINLYVELEQLRFNDAFEFEINKDKNINEFNTTVPVMLLQPYIENAIWHGLMNLENKRKGILKLNIKEQSGSLKIKIEDNGIGREKAREYRKADSHKSVGMMLTEQRLQMINKMQGYVKAEVTITDLYDEHKEPVGTRVEITLPIDEK